MLGIAPVYAVQQIRELRTGYRNTAATGGRPDEPPPFQPLDVKRHANTIMPQAFQQRAAAATEHVKITGVRVPAQPLLHLQRQRIHPTAHVGDPTRQPNPHVRRNRDHDTPRSAVSAAATTAESAAPVTRTRAPQASSTSTKPSAVG